MRIQLHSRLGIDQYPKKMHEKINFYYLRTQNITKIKLHSRFRYHFFVKSATNRNDQTQLFVPIIKPVKHNKALNMQS